MLAGQDQGQVMKIAAAHAAFWHKIKILKISEPLICASDSLIFFLK